MERLLKRINRTTHGAQINWSKIADSRGHRELKVQAARSR